MRCKFLPMSLHSVAWSQVTTVVAAVTAENGHKWLLSYQPEEANVKLEIGRCSKIVHYLPCYCLNALIWWDTALS